MSDIRHQKSVNKEKGKRKGLIMSLTIEEIRERYGYGCREKYSKPLLGDIFYQDKNEDVVYIVIACDEYDLTLLSISHLNTNVIFMHPLPEIGKYTDCNFIGNVLGAVQNDKSFHIEKERKYKKQALTQTESEEYKERERAVLLPVQVLLETLGKESTLFFIEQALKTDI